VQVRAKMAWRRVVAERAVAAKGPPAFARWVDHNAPIASGADHAPVLLGLTRGQAKLCGVTRCGVSAESAHAIVDNVLEDVEVASSCVGAANRGSDHEAVPDARVRNERMTRPVDPFE